MRNTIPLWLVFTPLFLFARQNAPEDTVMTVELEEITVTATRGGGEVMLVPMAVGLVEARDFIRSRRVGIGDALWGIPGVFAQSRSGGQDVRLTVRGFGARGNGDRSNAATIRGIKVLVDGFPETEPDGRTALDLVDLASAHRLEVVRSNASTLFGNASGGVINVETLPFFSRSFIETKNTFGAFGLRKNNFRFGMPWLSGRALFSLTDSRFDGWRAQTASSTTQLNTSLVFSPNDETRLRIIASGVRNDFQIAGPLTLAQFESDPTQANPTYAARRERRANRIARLGVSVITNLSETQSLEALAYVTPKLLQRSERNTFRDFTRFHLGAGAVYNLHLSELPWQPRFTFGLDESYQDGSALFYNLKNGERGDSLRTNKSEGANTFGTFLQAQLSISQDWSVTVGLRYDVQTYISRLYAAGARRADLIERLSLDHLTPRVALLYAIAPQHSFYLNIGGGVEAPAFNEVDPPPWLPNTELNPFLKPMTSTTIEAGLKGLIDIRTMSFMRSLSYSLAAYTITINNEIVPLDGGAWFSSAGTSRRNGMEGGVQAELRGGVSVKSALTVLHAEYRDYKNELGNFAGNDVPGIPPLVWNMRARYAPLPELSVELSYERVNQYMSDDANRFTVPGYALLGATMGYAKRVGAWRFSAFLGVQNITDERYAASAFINPVNPSRPNMSAAYLEPGLPRNVFGGLDVQFEL
jgi:iron complex outermembrane receptor protein